MAGESDAEDRVYRDRPEPARVREIRCMVCHGWLRLERDGSLPSCENCARNERVKKFRKWHDCRDEPTVLKDGVPVCRKCGR
jgi:hypothetical protein